MTVYKVERNLLFIGSKIIDLTHNICDVKETNKVLILLLDNPNSARTIDQPINNVLAVDIKGNIVWKIKDIIKEDKLYTGMRLDENNDLVVVEFNGINYTVNLNTKTIIKKIGIK